MRNCLRSDARFIQIQVPHLSHQFGWAIAKLCQEIYHPCMGTMNISLPDALKEFIDKQVQARGYSTSSEYVRELIRKDQERQHLRGLLLEGAASRPTKTAGDAHFEALRRTSILKRM